MRLQIRTLPRSTLFPYTTLFRSIVSPGFRHHGEREKSRQSFLYYEDPFFFKKPMVRPLSSQQVTGVWVPTFHFPLSLSMCAFRPICVCVCVSLSVATQFWRHNFW